MQLFCMSEVYFKGRTQLARFLVKFYQTIPKITKILQDQTKVTKALQVT